MGCGCGSASRPATDDDSGDSWEFRLRKYLLLLAMLVATVTYGAAFNPPGGVWQDADPAHPGRIAGDPIIREINRRRYLAFFYTNATAFALSLVVIVLVLILSVMHERQQASLAPLRILRGVMVLDLFSLMGAYAAGAFRDRLTAIYSLVLLAGVVLYLAIQTAMAWHHKARKQDSAAEKLRKVLMVLATFAVSVTYVAGLSAPGGFWDHYEGGHRPGDAVLKGGPHDARLKAFFVFNTTAFVASLLIIIILLDKKLTFSKNVRSVELYGFIAFTLIGLVGAYSAGSCRQVDTTIYVNSLIGAVIACILLQAAAIRFCKPAIKKFYKAATNCCFCNGQGSIHDKVSKWLRRTKECCLGQTTQPLNTGIDDASVKQQLENAGSLVLLLATLAAAITYQAGLNPPGGLWQADGVGYKAGDPILLTMSPRRFKAFYYCNSVAFVASLVAIVMVRMKTLHHHNALETAMILDLFGLIGAYAAGSCRDVSSSIYAVALAGAVLVYVVIHIVLFTLDHNDGGSTRPNDGGSARTNDAGSVRPNDEPSTEENSTKEEKDADPVKKRRKRLLLFAILAATITYQAGLTPPSGFLVTGDHAGGPVLLNNYPRRYTAFFYCNSVSFMLSIALIILLVNPNLYRPAIESNALSVCTAVGLMGIMGAYAAGSTQHRKTSIYIFALAGFVLSVVILLVVLFLVIKDKGKENETAAASTPEGRPAEEATHQEGRCQGCCISIGACFSRSADTEAPATDAADDMKAGSGSEKEYEKKLHAKRKYLMLLGILVAGITYQAGLAPPGGVWQNNDGRHEAGNPVMHDNRRHRYLAFFYSNSASFVASVVVIVLLLPWSPQTKASASRKGSLQDAKVGSLQTPNPAPASDEGSLQTPASASDEGSLQTPASASDEGSLQTTAPASDGGSLQTTASASEEGSSEKWWNDGWWLGVMNTTIVLDLLGLLVAYAAGSSRSWKTSGYVSALVIAVLAYFVIHVVLSCCVRISKSRKTQSQRGASQPDSVQMAES